MSSGDEADSQLAAKPASAAPAAAAPSAATTDAAIKSESAPLGAADFRVRARQAKFRIAMSTLKAGKVNTAASLLLAIYKEYAGTQEAKDAGAALGALAEEHEAAGRYHMAQELYAKLTED